MKYKEILKTFFKALMIGMVGKEALALPPIQIQCPTMDANKTILDVGILIDKYGFRGCGDTKQIDGINWKAECEKMSKTNDYYFMEGEYYDPVNIIQCRYRREQGSPTTKDLTLSTNYPSDMGIYTKGKFWTMMQSTEGRCEGRPWENNTAADCEMVIATSKP